jgi:Phage Mu protein F like protein
MFEQRAVSKENQQGLIQYFYNQFSPAIDAGYNPAIEMYNPALVHSLKYNVAEFSAFKETSFRKQLEAALVKDNKLVPWADYKNRADELNVEYNRRWLKIERSQTIAKANMAQHWEEFEQAKDLYPNLRFHTVGDARVREAHKVYDGLVLPINHPFWKTHCVPLDWGCRCTITQTDDDVSDYVPNQKEPLGNNPALTGKIFGDIPYKDGLSEKESNEASANLSDFLQGDESLISTKNPRVKISASADPTDLERNYQVADICAKKLDKDFVIRKHVEIKGMKNPEYLIDGKYLGDRKSIEGLNNMGNVITKSKEQMMNKSVNPKQVPHYIVWDLDKVEDLDFNTLTRTLQRKVTKERGRSIKGMMFQYNGKAAHITREEIVSRNFTTLDALK